ncbi:MAG: hypothetical protein QN229_02510 [Desulfurococcaceae archaeon TW002]
MNRKENLRIVFGFLDKSFISYVLPQQCLNVFLDKIPQELRELLGVPVTLEEVFISEDCIPLTGLVIHGSTPTGEQETYIEVYKGFLPPLPSFTPAQCVISLEGILIGCRYLLQKKYVGASCIEQDLHNQINKEELSELATRLFKSLSSGGLWLYVVDCGKKLTLVKVREKIIT